MILIDLAEMGKIQLFDLFKKLAEPIDPARVARLREVLDEYSPIIEDLANDKNLSEKRHRECLELLKVKKEFDIDKNPTTFVSRHRLDLPIMYYSAMKTLVDLSEPFGVELKQKTVKDIWSAYSSGKVDDKWKLVMDDVGLLNTLHRKDKRGRVEIRNEQDIKEINKGLQDGGWPSEVSFDGIRYWSGKNLQFTFNDRRVAVDDKGKVVLELDPSTKIVGPAHPGSEVLRQYFEEHEVYIGTDLNDK